jgi:hypothetical protein
LTCCAFAARAKEAFRPFHDSPLFARNVSSPVFLLPVCSVGSLGFFGDGPSGVEDEMLVAGVFGVPGVPGVRGELDRARF